MLFLENLRGVDCPIERGADSEYREVGAFLLHVRFAEGYLVGSTSNLPFMQRIHGFNFTEDLTRRVNELLAERGIDVPVMIKTLNDGDAAGIANILFDAAVVKTPGEKIGFMGPGTGLGGALYETVPPVAEPAPEVETLAAHMFRSARAKTGSYRPRRSPRPRPYRSR